ncbi:hypothetical protein JCM11641_004354 [Rhodosporidiobolus odoratus]
MFPSTRLFGTCPDWRSCTAYNCLFSHLPPAPSTARPTPTTTSDSTTRHLPQKRTAPTDAPQQLKPKKVANASAKAPASEAASTSKTSSNPTSAPGGNPAACYARPATSSTAVPAKATQDLPPNAGPPRLPMPKGLAHTPTATRQKMLTTLYNRFLDIYSPGILPTSLRHTLASKHALTQEATLFTRSTKATYRNACIGALARLKKRSPARTVEDTGTLEDEVARQAKQAEEAKGRLTGERVSRFMHDREVLSRFGYLLEVPSGKGGERVTEEGNVKACDRCKRDYVVKGELGPEDLHACAYHYGRMVTEKVGGTRQRVWSCCPSASAPPCQTGPHVFKDADPIALHSRVSFIPTSSLCQTSSSTSLATLPTAVDLAALDCELIYTTSGMSLARLTVLSSTGSLLLDEHVRPPPSSTMIDLNTRFSGVQPGDLDRDKAVLDVYGVRAALGQFVDEKTVLVGHGLENDLKALRVVHDRVIDTAILFPHPNGGTWRHSLRNLTKEILGKFIQEGDPTEGHSAQDDASAALELVRWKVKKEG